VTQRGLAPQGHESEGVVRTTPTANWIGDAPVGSGVGLYVDLLRSRLWQVAIIVVAAVGAAALVVALTDKVYEAEAQLLVTPIPDADQELFGLGLVSQSGDPTRDVETMATLITTTPVANRVRSELGIERSSRSLLKDVRAEPVAQSSLVTITAKGTDPRLAADLADAFAQSAIAVRTERMRALLDVVIPRLRAQLGKLPPVEERSREDLSERIRSLETLRASQDPTLHIEAPATPSTSPVAPRPVLSISAALVAGLVLAFGAVLGAHFLDPRIAREEDLRQYRIPVVGRIPRERRRLGQDGPLRPGELSEAAADAFHRLASSLATQSAKGQRSIFVTGASPNTGKSTVALNLGLALGARGDHVLLVDADSRRPTLAPTLGLTPDHGLADVVTGRASPSDALVPVDGLTAGSVKLLAQMPAESAPTPVTAEAADRLIRDATQHAEWVIVDGAALNYTPESLPLATQAATILLVVRLGVTRTRDLADLAELLVQQGITPQGFIVVGAKPRPVYR
jgi:Mrp family chromosome partitioning ATPase/capsular polysaccharide biosynthesis protein